MRRRLLFIMLISFVSLLIILLSPKVPYLRKIPGPLTAMVTATVIQSVFSLPGVATIGSAFGGIPQGLPELTLPQFAFSDVISLLGAAFTIAMLGAIESLLSAVVADGMTLVKFRYRMSFCKNQDCWTTSSMIW